MARRKRELTWYKPRQCWKKYREGKTYYLATGGVCNGPDDEHGYRLALQEWIDVLAALETQKTPPQQPQQPAGLVSYTLAPGTLPSVETQRELARVRRELTVSEEGEKGKEELTDYSKLDLTLLSPDRQSVETVGELIDCYLSARETEAQSGQLSIAQFAEDKSKLADFKSFCKVLGVKRLSQAFSAEVLEKYKLAQTQLLSEISPITAKKRLATVKKLTTWAYENEHLETLPRNLGKLAAVKLPDPKPQFFTKEEIKTLLGEATDRVKLYILLALNCGATQIDIATLKNEHVDWKEGIVTRPRNKTGVAGKYKLWPSTLALLKQFRSEGELVLRTEKGNPLVTHKIVDGKGSKTDSIRLSFERLKKKVGLNGRGFKCFRKTGANSIAEHFQDKPFLSTMYLAHSERGIKRHYTDQHWDLLFEALDYLGTELGVREG